MQLSIRFIEESWDRRLKSSSKLEGFLPQELSFYPGILISRLFSRLLKNRTGLELTGNQLGGPVITAPRAGERELRAEYEEVCGVFFSLRGEGFCALLQTYPSFSPFPFVESRRGEEGVKNIN